MMRDAERRLARLEARAQRRVFIPVAQELGLTVEELLRDLEAFFARPLEAQLAEVDQLAAECEARGEPWPQAADVRATLIREYRA